MSLLIFVRELIFTTSGFLLSLFTFVCLFLLQTPSFLYLIMPVVFAELSSPLSQSTLSILKLFPIYNSEKKYSEKENVGTF